MAAIVMIFEMTLDYTVIIPMTMTVALSYGVRVMLQPREYLHPETRPPGPRDPGHARGELRSPQKGKRGHGHPTPVRGSRLHDRRLHAVRVRPPGCLVLSDRVPPEGLVGFLTRASLWEPSVKAQTSRTVADIADRKFITVSEETPLHDVMTRAWNRRRRRDPGRRCLGQPLVPKRARTGHKETDRRRRDRRAGGFFRVNVCERG